MKELSTLDQNVLRMLGQGVPDADICVAMKLSLKAFSSSIQRIEIRAAVETDDAGKIYQRALRIRAERRCAGMQARLSALIALVPQAVLIVDGRSGMIKECNENACQLFGYSMEELLDLKVEALLAEEIKAFHVAYRLGFLASVRKREIGYHPPIFGIRKNGSQVQMSIGLTATVSDEEVMVVCEEFLVDSAKGANARTIVTKERIP